MKIGIITLPLHHNYGGILQAFALQTALKRMGHSVWLIDRQDNKMPIWKFPLVIIKRIFLKYVLGKHIPVFTNKSLIEKHLTITLFIEKYITPKTAPYYSTKALKKVNDYNFDAYIVGSDQVWREGYYRKWKKNFFFDFVRNNLSKRIGFAVSFGVENWEYDKKTTKEISKLVKKFSAISVREDTAIALCNDHLGINAVHLIDPTMLIDVSDYIKLVKDEADDITIQEELLLYILDKTDDKDEMISYISKQLQYKTFTIGIQSQLIDEKYPSITSWLNGFKNAKYIITDSFHGCVFSILFNKDFIVFGNEFRGQTRLNSLLKMFKLEERLIMNSSELTQEKSCALINWDDVNKIVVQKRFEAYEFLNNNLNK